MYVKYESSITYHSKAMANIKVFADKEMDRRTNTQAKNYMPMTYRCRGHKKEENAGDMHFLLFTHCFQKASFTGWLNIGIVYGN